MMIRTVGKISGNINVEWQITGMIFQKHVSVLVRVR